VQTENVAPAQTETIAPEQTENVAPVQTETIATENVASVQTETVAPVQMGLAAPGQTEQGAPARTEQAVLSKTEQRPELKTGEAASSPMTGDPAVTSSINRLSVAGQPLCMDPDALVAMLVAGLLTSNPNVAATNGCQVLAEDAKLTRLQSYPSVFPFMRIVRVEVTSPTQPKLTYGFTIEMGQ
jgi:hypothetical protein